jgi:hypothetical protein
VAAEFVALADLLRAPDVRAVALEAPPAAAASCEPVSLDDGACDDAVACRAFDHGVPAGVVDAVREARLFRARLADAFDDAAARLLRELASDVLARELRLAPCDLAEIVRRVAERAPVVRVRVAACDAARVAGTSHLRGRISVVEDPALAAGDAAVELAGGALDARLGVRLATVLEAFA